MNFKKNKYYIIVFLIIVILTTVVLYLNLKNSNKVNIANKTSEPFPNNSTSFIYDFEINNDLSNTNCITEEKANSGKKSSKVDSLNPYSTTINKKISDIKCSDIKKVYYGAWIYTTEQNTDASLVLSIKDTINNKDILWIDISLNKSPLTLNKWTYIEKAVNILPEQIKNGHVFNVYIWNRGKSTIYIDDIMIDFCRKPSNLLQSFIVKDFNPLTNWNIDTLGNKTNNQQASKLIYLDYKNAINGFVIPSENQSPEKGFVFQFKIKNIGENAQKYYYKIYYQNETYKFSERDDRCDENFYGSWADVNKKFASTQDINNNGEYYTITDTFTISANPRNEAKYYYKGKNDKWKRNPRTGNYSFLLIVASEETFNKMPSCISDISLKEQDKYVNPFLYFLYNDGKKLKNIAIKKSKNYLKVVASPPFSQELYTNTVDSNQYQNAVFKQYANTNNISEKYYNIPVIADVLSDNYTTADYNKNKSTFTKKQLIEIKTNSNSQQTKSAYLDKKTNKIIIQNPKSTAGNWQKQNAGIASLHGFTYGKHTVKIKLTKLLNKNDVWNGITNTIELANQEGKQDKNHPWNTRRACLKNDGYINNTNKHVDIIDFSKIAFELIKSISYCSDGIQTEKPNEKYKNNIMVTCANWDMACANTTSTNCQTLNYQGGKFKAHRWSENYKSINETPALDDELFGSKYYYFQIEWRPTEIIWRMGPEKDKLKVVGYMNESITSIPNNQMIMNIIQRYDITKLPETPYLQEFIPFPKNEIKGEIYEYTIE